MEINQKKLERQLGIVDKWVKNGAKGTFEACTGFGKTYTAILGIKRFRKKYPIEPINVVVPSIDLKSQWEEVLKYNSIENVRVWVVNTYIKYTHSVALLVLDEVHGYLSDEFYKVFENTTYTLILCLTATLERQDGRHTMLEEIAPIFDTVTLEEARREGYISDFTVYNLGLRFNEKDAEDYNRYHSITNNNFAYFQRDFDFAMMMSKSDKAYIARTNHDTGLVERKSIASIREEWARMQGWNGEPFNESLGDSGTNYYHPMTVKLKAMQWLKSMQKRKQMIYTASVKIETIKSIIERFPDKKVIVFSENSEFADKVAEALGEQCKSYHTKLKTEVREERIEKVLKSGKVKVEYKTKKYGKDRLRKEIIQQFKEGRFKILSVVRAVDEGFDDEDVDMVCMAAYNSSKRQNTQRTGRGVRAKEGKHSLVINLYMIDSQEEKWLKSKQGMNTKVSWIKKVQDIHDISTFSLT